MIPKNLFLYHGGTPLSFLRYLTIYSFKKYNPEWTIKLYIPYKSSGTKITWNTGEQFEPYEGKDYIEKLKEENIEIIEFDMETIGCSNDIPEVHKSGILRAYLLQKYGGIYADTDIIFFNKLNIPEGKNIIQCFNEKDRYFSDGFIGCEKDNEMFKKLFEMTKNMNNTSYQGYGLNIWNKYFKPENNNYPKNIWNIPMSLLYFNDSTQVGITFEKNRTIIPEDSIGCHWYGGHIISRKWENKITENNYDYETTICNIIKKVYND